MVVYLQFEFLSKLEFVSSQNSPWYIVDVLYLSLAFLLAISQESPLAVHRNLPSRCSIPSGGSRMHFPPQVTTLCFSCSPEGAYHSALPSGEWGEPTVWTQNAGRTTLVAAMGEEEQVPAWPHGAEQCIWTGRKMKPLHGEASPSSPYINTLGRLCYYNSVLTLTNPFSHSSPTSPTPVCHHRLLFDLNLLPLLSLSPWW